MSENNKEIFKEVIPLSCEGNCSEKMEIRIYGENEIDVWISFSADTFYAGQSILGILRERFKLAWLAIRKGNYIHNEIVTNIKALSELNGKLSETLERLNPKTIESQPVKLPVRKATAREENARYRRTHS